jgi:hypothetical protein
MMRGKKKTICVVRSVPSLAPIRIICLISLTRAIKFPMLALFDEGVCMGCTPLLSSSVSMKEENRSLGRILYATPISASHRHRSCPTLS